MHRTPNLDFPPTAWRYHGVAVFLHWALALLLTLLTGLGWYMLSIEDQPGSAWYFNTHKSVGIVVAFLVIARVAWRLTHRPAPLPGRLSVWQRGLAMITQILLYVLMVLMPVTGYLGASYSKAGVAIFGSPTPRWALPDHDLAEQFFGIHGALIWVLVALVALHVAGALKHLWIDKDGVFERMRFASKR